MSENQGRIDERIESRPEPVSKFSLSEREDLILRVLMDQVSIAREKEGRTVQISELAASRVLQDKANSQEIESTFVKYLLLLAEKNSSLVTKVLSESPELATVLTVILARGEASGIKDIAEVMGISKEEARGHFERLVNQAARQVQTERLNAVRSATLYDVMGATAEGIGMVLDGRLRVSDFMANSKVLMRPIAKSAVHTSLSPFHTILFLTALHVAEHAKSMARGHFSDLSPREQLALFRESAMVVVNDPTTYAGILGHRMGDALTYLPRNMAMTAARTHSRLPKVALGNALAQQAFGLVSFSGWMMVSQLYQDVTEELPEAREIQNVLRDAKLRDQIHIRLDEMLRNGETLESFRRAIYQAVLTGDTIYFLGLSALGAQAGGMLGTALTGNVVGTVAGGLLGGLAGAFGSVFLPDHGKARMSDALANIPRFFGEEERKMARSKRPKVGETHTIRTPVYKGRDVSYAVRTLSPDQAEIEWMDTMQRTRSHVMDPVFSLYARNLSMWAAAQERLDDLNSEVSEEAFVQRFESDPEFMRLSSEIREFTIRESAATARRKEIRELEKKRVLYDRKIRDSYAYLYRVLGEEAHHFFSLRPITERVDQESARLERAKILFEQVFHPKMLREERTERNNQIALALRCLQPMVLHGFYEERFFDSLFSALMEATLQSWITEG